MKSIFRKNWLNHLIFSMHKCLQDFLSNPHSSMSGPWDFFIGSTWYQRPKNYTAIFTFGRSKKFLLLKYFGTCRIRFNEGLGPCNEIYKFRLRHFVSNFINYVVTKEFFRTMISRDFIFLMFNVWLMFCS